MVKNMITKEEFHLALDDAIDKFDLQVSHFVELRGGYMNKVWHISGSDDIVLKIFSNERYPQSRLDEINQALELQLGVSKLYKHIPKVYSHNGRVIQTKADVHYMVMSYHEGVERNYNTINLEELIRLGQTCGEIHKSLNLGTDKNIICDQMNNLSVFLSNMEDHLWKKPYDMVPNQIRNIYKSINKEFYKGLPIGMTHADFSADNMIFANGQVHIIDFDRSRVSYQYQDVGRAIMCFAFDGKQLNLDRTEAFVNGYNRVKKLTICDVIKAIKLTWIIEVSWWMWPNLLVDNTCQKPNKFARELLWITENFFNLDKLIKQY